MKTLEEIKTQYQKQAIDGRDMERLSNFFPAADQAHFGMAIKPEYLDTYQPLELTRENILKELKEDVDFGFTKALNQRGISAHAMFACVHMWNWILEDGLEEFTHYGQYGLPLFKATAVKYGWDNPIGEDTGNEPKYSTHHYA